jgi:hypothetical protein
MNIIDITFIKSPTRTMSDIFKYLDPNTTALGGVATGNIKAQEAESVAPTINK